jgi:hypothetical protein
LQPNTAAFAIKKIHIGQRIIRRPGHELRVRLRFRGKIMPQNRFFASWPFRPALLALALSAGSSLTASAANDCLGSPDRPSAAGSHWYYRIDRATQRRCWYLKQFQTSSPNVVAAPEPARTRAEAPPPSTFMSWLSSMVGGAAPITPAPNATPQAETSEIPSPQGANRSRRLQSANATPPSPRARSAPPSSSKTQEPRSPSYTGDDALFLEYLSWRQRQLLSQ